MTKQNKLAIAIVAFFSIGCIAVFCGCNKNQVRRYHSPAEKFEMNDDCLRCACETIMGYEWMFSCVCNTSMCKAMKNDNRKKSKDPSPKRQ